MRGYKPIPKPPPVVMHTRADGTTYRVLTPELARYWLNIWAARKTIAYRAHSSVNAS